MNQSSHKTNSFFENLDRNIQILKYDISFIFKSLFPLRASLSLLIFFEELPI